MESKEATQVKVGIFVFLGVLFTMGIIFFLGSENQLFERQYNLYAHYRDISGLRVGAQVQLAGIRVGTVDQISFPTEVGEKNLRIRLRINQEFQERIREDSVAMVNTQGLLGDKFIAISIGGLEAPVLADGATIQTDQRPSIFSVAEKGLGMVGSLDEAARSVTKFFAAIEKDKGLLHSLIHETPDKPVGKNTRAAVEDFKLAAHELKELLSKINRGEGTIGALINDPSLYYDIRKLFGKVERNRLLRKIIRSRVEELDQEK